MCVCTSSVPVAKQYGGGSPSEAILPLRAVIFFYLAPFRLTAHTLRAMARSRMYMYVYVYVYVYTRSPAGF